MSASETGLETVRTVVEPAVRALGLDLYDVELLGGAGARTLRVTVTREQGVDLEAITAVTQAVSPLVDQADAVPGSYLLEVSSPGVERTLRRPEHFSGAIGEHVSIKFRAGKSRPDEGTRRVRGVLVEVDPDRCIVESDAGAREEIAMSDVTQARTVFEWGPQPRPGKDGRSHARAKEQR